MKDILNGALAF